jgi:hypothetical protein
VAWRGNLLLLLSSRWVGRGYWCLAARWSWRTFSGCRASSGTGLHAYDAGPAKPGQGLFARRPQGAIPAQAWSSCGDFRRRSMDKRKRESSARRSCDDRRESANPAEAAEAADLSNSRPIRTNGHSKSRADRPAVGEQRGRACGVRNGWVWSRRRDRSRRRAGSDYGRAASRTEPRPRLRTTTRGVGK